MNPVVIILLTYQRTEYAIKTILGVKRFLRYPNLLWYVADDGSFPEHVQTILSELEDQKVIGFHSERLSYGGSANKAWHFAHDNADLTLFLEDDWELSRELILNPFVDTLDQDSSLGMVRMGYLNVGMRGQVFGQNGIVFLRLDSSTVDPAFTGHPSLRHRRFREAYGAYPEGLDPGNTELTYAYQVKKMGAGPDIIWPITFGAFGPFGHIGEQKSYP